MKAIEVFRKARRIKSGMLSSLGRSTEKLTLSVDAKGSSSHRTHPQLPVANTDGSLFVVKKSLAPIEARLVDYTAPKDATEIKDEPVYSASIDGDRISINYASTLPAQTLASEDGMSYSQCFEEQYVTYTTGDQQVKDFIRSL